MEIGESVAVVTNMMTQNVCAICGQKHEAPKRVVIKEVAPNNTGWQRKAMSNVFHFDGMRETIYPNSTFPPHYTYEGHHCIALSAFALNPNKSKSKPPKDIRLRLNFYLDQIGFFPNRPQNCIGLPAQKSNGDFVAFFSSIECGKPLQMHGRQHDKHYFAQCDRLLTQLVHAISKLSICKKRTEDAWKDLLKLRIAQAENYAFKQLAKNQGTWRLQPAEQSVALELYCLPATQSMNVRVQKGGIERRNGLGHAAKPIKFPDLDLSTGPF